MITVAELAERIGAELIGEGSGCVTAVGPIEASSETDVTFVADDKHLVHPETSHKAVDDFQTQECK